MFCPEYVLRILNRIEEKGETAYIVGGSVRDSLLGIVANDFDIAVSCPPEKTAEIFSDMHVIPTGIKHGTVTVISDGYPIEITTFRVDGSYRDSRHPDSVSFTDDIFEDLSRRDFTVNAMAYNPRKGLVDIFGGQSDLDAKLIRAVGDPEKRFGEDALRILRAFRFSAQLGFDIDPETLEGARAERGGLDFIARERIGVEFIKLVCSEHPKKALKYMKEYGILTYILGDHVPSDRVISLLPEMPRTDIGRLGFLLCHSDAQSSESILRSLRCSSKQIKGSLCVRRGANMCVKYPEDARRFSAQMGDHAEVAVRASVLLGNSPEEAIRLVDDEKNAVRSVRDLKICGRELSELGFYGKELGEMLELLLEKVMCDPSLNEKKRLLDIAVNYKKRN